MSLIKRTTPTEKQIAACRANGAKSRGPVTPQGKRNSSANSRRYPNYFAAAEILTPEESAESDQFLAELIDHFQPRDPDEHNLVRTIAHARAWIYHYWKIGNSKPPRSTLPNCPSVLDLLSRLENRRSTRAYKAIDMIAKHQKRKTPIKPAKSLKIKMLPPKIEPTPNP